MAKRTPPSNGNGHAAADAPIRPLDRVPESEPTSSPLRLPVLKTYKLYIGGKFPRSESGRYDVVRGTDGQPLANVSKASKKDFRDSVVAARAAQAGWAKRSAYNRAQILYRIAEMLEGRSAQFVEELLSAGAASAAGVAGKGDATRTAAKAAPTASDATREVQAAVDRLVYYAGWADKYTQVFSGVNPVASSHFNFSLHEPTGLVVIVAPDAPALLGLVTLVSAAIVGGNSTIVLASETNPLPAVTLSEVLATSDLPGGVVNILAGQRAELIEHFASHMDVNAVVYGASGAGEDREQLRKLQQLAANNVKRVVQTKIADYYAERAESPYLILDTQEVKTTWHPVGT